MELHLVFTVHSLPFWFLVLALFLPRLSIALMWFGDLLRQFHVFIGIVPILFWIILPRALVLYLIYVDQGISLWFILHFVVAIMVWGGSGRYHTRRRRNRFDS
jgi:hypothetical protein